MPALTDDERWLLGLDPFELEELALDLSDDERLALAATLDRLAERPAPEPGPDEDDDPWQAWLPDLLGAYFPAPFADHHATYWDHVWSIRPGMRPDPFVGIWPRGGAKSTSTEAACAALGTRRRRRYALYVCETQDQANDHVGNVGDMLRSPAMADRYPAFALPRVGIFGQVRAWRRTRLWTEGGFVIDAIGLDRASRGVKLEERRPDLLVVDDVDNEEDGPLQIARKVRSLTRRLFPAGSDDVAVLAVQNLIHESGVFAQLAGLAEEPADFLRDRIVVGPVPAVEDLDVEEREDGGHVIVGGRATWSGQSLRTCQANIDDWGYTAFLIEAQHEVSARSDGIFAGVTFLRHPADVALPDFETSTCWIDPAVTDTDKSDAQAIQVDALGPAGVIYRLWSYEHRGSPRETVKIALRKCAELGIESFGIETDQGGDTWEDVVAQAYSDLAAEGLVFETRPRYLSEKAGAGYGSKAHRAALMLADYQRGGRIVHVVNEEATHLTLERSLRRFGLRKPFDLTDAAYWSWRYLRHGWAPATVGQASGRVPLRTAGSSPGAVGRRSYPSIGGRR